MLHTLHRLSALIISLYVLSHITNHLVALSGIEAHISFMQSFRQIYRTQIIEPLLLACALFQVGSGITFIVKRWGQRRGFFDHAQAVSGGYLAFFLMFHISAVMYGRLVQGLDTNFFFAAAGLQPQAYPLFFAPYYTLAVAAFFTHLACGLRWIFREKFSTAALDRSAGAVMAVGLVIGLTIVTTFSGTYYLVPLPEEYCLTAC
ncbi:hypothetical protein BTJ40_01790 [Microbulbifer sp. A4B17]|uniref:hypothetical protein n=1 Tax=Microbulbifer sp. A4B17 TaxID=359370 RepID=UPI000D52E07F|nr:hypothetical protein [Microbulbifer sp. A4B17]AWF79662.1 hypothetical protein BTJ40_01790 [Microbulbifer sp. A4B17]